MTKTLEKVEFGDFQTPYLLAIEVCQYLAEQGVLPASIVEPTCGKGAFLAAAIRSFPEASAWGREINPAHVAKCQQAVAGHPRCNVSVADFFETDWQTLLGSMAEPILVIGNPPWVTNSALSALGSANLPSKSNFQGHKGLDAITGKSNFDISEWMLLHILERLDGRRATLAMLCKTVVARKVLQHAWKNGLQIERAELRRIDASAQFNAAVDACLFCCTMQPEAASTECQVFDALNDSELRQNFGYLDGRLVAEISAFGRRRHLLGESSYRWRSGVKHDCSKVMELSETPHGLKNGLGECVDLERKCLFPMLKSSELANGRTEEPRRWMIVTQQEVGQETSPLEVRAPKTWEYLVAHADRLDKRGSSIYRKRPRFSVFGVGGYSFSPWKVAVSGFYKSLGFVRLGPFTDKPIVLDDTSYLLACNNEREADFVYDLLTSEAATEFYSSLIFWDAKRPITTDLLSALSLEKLAEELGRTVEFEQFATRNPWTKRRFTAEQSTLFG
jgi:hypothetical protein